ncbi:MAG TPA: hypothetical protein VFJ43_04165, partial [Bacteroidia bacterium]|nr:hypothetical protein [Bacteroidia bacterium]
MKNNLRSHLRTPRYLREIIFLLFIGISCCAKAQQSNVPLNYDWIQDVEAKTVQNRGFILNNYLMSYEADSTIRALIKTNEKGIIDPTTVVIFPEHTSMRPWIEQGHPLRKNILLQNSTNEKKIFYTQDRWPPWFLSYHTKNSLLNLEREPKNGEPIFRLYIDPLANLQEAFLIHDERDSTVRRLFTNTRGISAHGDIGRKISFETTFYENQSFFPQYLKDFAYAKQVIPGQGRWKAFKRSGFDYAMSMGYLSYSPCRNFNVQIGTGKHFVGDGYRSLLLSDNSFPYPYARLTGWFGPDKMFQYTTIYASLMNLQSVAPIPMGTERLYQKKAASFYQLSANIGRIAEVSLFQGLIWSAADDRNKQCIQLAYVNPVIFTSVPFYGLHDKHNFLLGATFHLDLLKTIRL